MLLRAGQRRLEHGRRPHRGRPARAGPAAPPAAAPGADPRRLRRRHHEFLTWLTRRGREPALLGRVHHHRGHRRGHRQDPRPAWTPAYDADGQVRTGAWVAEITGLLDLTAWPDGYAGHRPQGTPAPRRAAAVHRHRRLPAHLRSPPTPKVASWRTWNCVTGAGPGARTGSAARRTPGCGTCRCRTSPRTRSGARSSPWPANCSPGCRCSPCTAPRAGGSSNGCGCACSPSPVDWSAAAAACGCASPRLVLGYLDHRRDRPL